MVPVSIAQVCAIDINQNWIHWELPHIRSGKKVLLCCPEFSSFECRYHFQILLEFTFTFTEQCIQLVSGYFIFCCWNVHSNFLFACNVNQCIFYLHQTLMFQFVNLLFAYYSNKRSGELYVEFSCLFVVGKYSSLFRFFCNNLFLL